MAAPEVLLTAIWRGAEQDCSVRHACEKIVPWPVVMPRTTYFFMIFDSTLFGPKPVPGSPWLQHSELLRSIQVVRSHPERVFEKVHAGASRLSMMRMVAMSIMASDVCTAYS